MKPLAMRLSFKRPLILSLFLTCAPTALASDYLQGKISSAGDNHSADTYRISGVYGVPIRGVNGTSFEMDVSFLTDNFRIQENQTVMVEDSLDLRPEKAGLYLLRSVPLYRGTHCADLYFRSGLVYSDSRDSFYDRALGWGSWSPGFSVGMSHQTPGQTSYLMDLTREAGENTFTFGVSFKINITSGR